MRKTLTLFTALLLSIAAGCQPATVSIDNKELLTVDFKKNQTLRYNFKSSRKISIVWDSTSGSAKPNRADNFTEFMDIVIAYTPIEINPYGLTKIKATCGSAKVNRTKSGRKKIKVKDAVESVRGESFVFTVGPNGKIEDYSGLTNSITKLGDKAFRPKSTRGRIKEPDMIGDFLASQWFLWDSIASIKNPSEGVAAGQSWQSQLSVPLPMVMRKARDVIYNLEEIRETEKGKVAVIKSSYTLADSVDGNWPLPYSGAFQMSGTFGFLRNYVMMGLQGEGEELFNIDLGRIQKYHHKYNVQIEARLPAAFKVTPRIDIRQDLTMELLEN